MYRINTRYYSDRMWPQLMVSQYITKILARSLSGTQQVYRGNTFTKTAKEGLKPLTCNRYSIAGNWALQHFTETEWKPYYKYKVQKPASTCA